jgi:hypothetical protein
MITAKLVLVLSTRNMTERKENNMAKSKSRSLPRFRSLAELVEFFEARDLGEYWDEMPEVHFEVDIKKRTHLVAIDADSSLCSEPALNAVKG